MDRWQGSPNLADERTKAFPGNTTIFEEGTPIDASAHLEPSYKASDRRTFKVQCPHCGEYQQLRFFPYCRGELAGKGGIGGLKDDRGNWRSPREARKHVHYICVHGCRIDEDDKPEMVRRGVWCPDGQTVNRRGELKGEPANPGRHRGYRINSLYSNSITWADAAEYYLTNRDTTEGLKRFFNDWLGMGFEPRGETPKWKDLGLRLAGTYPRRAVPKVAYFLTAAADVQLRGVYWSIRAWGHGKTSWLIDFGYLPKRQPSPDDDTQEQLASDLAQLDATILDRYWDVAGENPMGHSRLAVRVLGVDCGYRPNDVYAYVRAHPGDRVLAVRGDPKIVPGTLWRLSKLERNARTGKIYPEGTQAWGIETNAYKTEIADRWMADRTQPGAWWLPEDILATDGGEDYLRQITAESRRAEVLNGRKVLRWDLISHGADNHYWDTEVYCCCLADMVTGQQWDAREWLKAAAPRRPQPTEQVQTRGRGPVSDFSAR